MNIMTINGYKAVITYDNDIEMFRGEFINLNGGADFYADTVEKLRKEGAISLKVFLEVCQEKGIKPKKEYSGKLPLRIPSELHEKLAEQAMAEGKSINQLVQNTLAQYFPTNNH